MKKFAVLAILVLASVVAVAQVSLPDAPTPSHFSINANVISLPGNNSSFPAADVGAKVNLTKNIVLRTDNILGGAIGFQGYYGGIEYPITPIENLLKKTYFNPANWGFYGTGSAGVDITGNGPTAKDHFSALLGGGLNHYNGALTENVFEIRWAKLPGFNPSTVIVSTGVKWTLF